MAVEGLRIEITASGAQAERQVATTTAAVKRQVAELEAAGKRTSASAAGSAKATQRAGGAAVAQNQALAKSSQRAAMEVQAVQSAVAQTAGATAAGIGQASRANKQYGAEVSRSAGGVKQALQEATAMAGVMGGKAKGSIDQAKGAWKGAAVSALGLSKAVGPAGLGVVSLGAAFKAYSFAKGAVATTTSLAGATRSLQAITKMDVRTASTWVEVAKVRGIEGQKLGLMFGTLSRNIRAADQGSKGAVKTFAQIGLSQREVARSSPHQLILKTADAFKSGLVPATQQAAVAQQLFGRNGRALLPLLQSGSEGINKQFAIVSKYHAYLSAGGAKSAKDFADAQRKQAIAVDGLKIAIGERLIPILTSGSQKLTDFIGEMNSGKGAGGAFAEEMRNDARSLSEFVGGLKDAGEWLDKMSAKADNAGGAVNEAFGGGDPVGRARDFSRAVAGGYRPGTTSVSPNGRAGGRVTQTGIHRYAGGGLVPAMVSPGEMLVHGGGAMMVPGTPEPRDSVFMGLPQGTAVLTRSGQGMVAGGASVDQAVRQQAPHFAKGGWARVGATWDPPQPGNPSMWKQTAHGGMSFAELLVAGANAGLRGQDMAATLGMHNGQYGLPIGAKVAVRMPGASTAYTITKSDNGSGQPGNARFKIDLHKGIANRLGWRPNQDVEIAAVGTPGAAPGAAGASGPGSSVTRMTQAAQYGVSEYDPRAAFEAGVAGTPLFQDFRGRDTDIFTGIAKAAGYSAAQYQTSTVPGTSSAGDPAAGGAGTSDPNFYRRTAALKGLVADPSGSGKQVAAWIAPEIKWAKQHGWHGQITSGYRSPAHNAAVGGAAGSEHMSMGPYPHGAVDFGGWNSGGGIKAAFFRAAASYPGPKLRGNNFGDEGHASGSGHRRGGWVGGVPRYRTGTGNVSAASFGPGLTRPVPGEASDLGGGMYLGPMGITRTPPAQLGATGQIMAQIHAIEALGATAVAKAVGAMRTIGLALQGASGVTVQQLQKMAVTIKAQMAAIARRPGPMTAAQRTAYGRLGGVLNQVDATVQYRLGASIRTAESAVSRAQYQGHLAANQLTMSGATQGSAAWQAGLAKIDQDLIRAYQQQIPLVQAALSTAEAMKKQDPAAIAALQAELDQLKTGLSDAQVQAYQDSTQATQDNTAATQDQTQLLEDQNQNLQDLTEILKKRADEANRAARVANSQFDVLKRAISEVSNQGLGGMVGLKAQTPGTPGRLARYR